jgi:hypothetical protein
MAHLAGDEIPAGVLTWHRTIAFSLDANRDMPEASLADGQGRPSVCTIFAC